MEPTKIFRNTIVENSTTFSLFDLCNPTTGKISYVDFFDIKTINFKDIEYLEYVIENFFKFKYNHQTQAAIKDHNDDYEVVLDKEHTIIYLFINNQITFHGRYFNSYGPFCDRFLQHNIKFFVVADADAKTCFTRRYLNQYSNFQFLKN